MQYLNKPRAYIFRGSVHLPIRTVFLSSMYIYILSITIKIFNNKESGSTKKGVFRQHQSPQQIGSVQSFHSNWSQF